VEVELIELVRSELATLRDEVQSAMSDTAAVLSDRVRSEIEHRMGEPRALVAGIQGVRETIAGRDSELIHALERVGSTYESLAERVHLDRIDQTALTDAISRLATALAHAGSFALPSSNGPTTVIGGTVEPTPTPAEAIFTRADLVDAEPDREIDLEAIAAAPGPVVRPPAGRPVRPDGVEVRCRFGDRWVTGFEVCEVIRVDDTSRYRLRRRSDGSVIPTLFDEKDLRFFSTSFVDPT
jgi:hypothetical protein